MVPGSEASSLFKCSHESSLLECFNRGPVEHPVLPTAPTDAEENNGAVVAWWLLPVSKYERSESGPSNEAADSDLPLGRERLSRGSIFRFCTLEKDHRRGLLSGAACELPLERDLGNFQLEAVGTDIAFGSSMNAVFLNEVSWQFRSGDSSGF